MTCCPIPCRPSRWRLPAPGSPPPSPPGSSPIPTPWCSPPRLRPASHRRAVVLCKEFDVELGRVSFVTNYDSRKGRETRRKRTRRAGVSLGSRASPDPRRGRGAEGCRKPRVTTTSQSRNWQRRIGAWASAQSQPLRGREQLNAAVRAAAQRFGTPEPTLDNINDTQTADHSAPALLGWLLRLGGRRRIVDRRRIAHPRARALDAFANYRRRRSCVRGPWTATRLQP